MTATSPIKGLTGWIAHRLFFNYWSLAVSAVVLAVPIAYGVLWLDRNGGTAWLLAHDLSPIATADTAKDFAGVASGVNAAFVTLYFSITLIVLSMAAGNLGVRLIDRWIQRPLTRISLAGLSFSLVVSLIAMMSIDAEADLPDTPLLLVGLVLALQVVNMAMLSVSLHHLGRTMFVDTSIQRIFADAKGRQLDLVPGKKEEIDWAWTMRATREGYIEGVDLERLRDLLATHPGRVRIEVAPGAHVLQGEALLRTEEPVAQEAKLHRTIPIGDYRSDSQGTVFRIRLLVEIGARALSPAVNDFYTAITCADRLAAVMDAQADLWIDAESEPLYAPAPRFVLPGQDYRGLFEDPLNAFRQAACEYPSVTIRMVDNYRRLAAGFVAAGRPGELVSFIDKLAHELADHAIKIDAYGRDIDDIKSAYAKLCDLLDEHGIARQEAA